MWLARRATGGGGWDACPGPRVRPPKEALPEHLGRTVTVAGLSVVCLVPVRSGAMVGGRLGGGGTAEVRTLGLRRRKWGVRADRARPLTLPPSHPQPNQRGCGPPTHH